jgi:hypothetical protein
MSIGGGYITDLHTPDGINGDRAAVRWVLRLRPKLDGLAPRAHCYLRAAAGTALVRIVWAYHGYGHGRMGHAAKI